MTSHDEKLPHWDLTPVYQSLESNAFQTNFEAIIAEIHALVALFDEHGIDRLDEPLVVTADTIQTFETIVSQFNQLGERVQTLYAYISAHLATNSRDDLAQAHHSKLQRPASRLAGCCSTRLAAWLGSLDVASLDRPV
jgi:oligoendopeptidase F